MRAYVHLPCTVLSAGQPNCADVTALRELFVFFFTRFSLVSTDHVHLRECDAKTTPHCFSIVVQAKAAVRQRTENVTIDFRRFLSEEPRHDQQGKMSVSA